MSTTSVSPTARQIWSRSRGLLIAAAILAVTGLILAALRSGEQHGLLDPRSPDRYGSRAAAQLLAERGVDTSVVTTSTQATAAAGPDATVLVIRPDTLGDEQQDSLRELAERGGRTVLVSPGAASLPALAPGVRAADDTAEIRPTPHDCGLPAAERAGEADLGGRLYEVSDERADVCYLREGLPALVRVPAATGDGDTVLLGAPDPLYNDRLDDLGNASLTLQLLGSRSHLVWYLPSLSDSAAGDDGDRGFFELVPEGWTWGALQLAVAAVLAALWRARRLGPLVTENLPVAVRASEAAEGRARLYRKANARGRAAQELRTASRARLAPLLGVATADAHDPEVLPPALAGHTTLPPGPSGPGDDGTDVHSLLFGHPPPDDAALIRLADELDRLERLITPASVSARSSPTASPTDKDRPS